ncbi:hypothetical protein Q7P37_003570 [Cladosporium fusiforme]
MAISTDTAATRYLILLSRQGKVRLAKWFTTLSPKDKAKIIKDVSQLVLARRTRMCNFLEYKDTKVVYRRYASLFFIAATDNTDNELITLEIVHRYVEQMDKYYGNVCELDIIFNFQKAYFILDELLIAGEMQESSKKNVLRVIGAQDSLEDMEPGLLSDWYPGINPQFRMQHVTPSQLPSPASLRLAPRQGRRSWRPPPRVISPDDCTPSPSIATNKHSFITQHTEPNITNNESLHPSHFLDARTASTSLTQPQEEKFEKALERRGLSEQTRKQTNTHTNAFIEARLADLNCQTSPREDKEIRIAQATINPTE